MTDTNPRDLIQRMAKELDLYRQIARDNCTSTHPLADQARAYLAQSEPEGPTDEELRRRFLIWWREEASAMRPHPEPVGPTDPKLIPLEEHNRRKLMGALPSIPNGIACPKCGKELMDSNPDCILLTHPNQCRVHCPHCDWSGTRF